MLAPQKHNFKNFAGGYGLFHFLRKNEKNAKKFACKDFFKKAMLVIIKILALGSNKELLFVCLVLRQPPNKQLNSWTYDILLPSEVAKAGLC